mmetsp:Transcript_4923/g.13924  ORF Transcript_4923/g.13924 Transcript_4923/m.13924 type:complete len:201 (+) Transcript_4923:351-953(+)
MAHPPSSPSAAGGDTSDSSSSSAMDVRAISGGLDCRRGSAAGSAPWSSAWIFSRSPRASAPLRSPTLTPSRLSLRTCLGVRFADPGLGGASSVSDPRCAGTNPSVLVRLRPGESALLVRLRLPALGGFPSLKGSRLGSSSAGVAVAAAPPSPPPPPPPDAFGGAVAPPRSVQQISRHSSMRASLVQRLRRSLQLWSTRCA